MSGFKKYTHVNYFSGQKKEYTELAELSDAKYLADCFINSAGDTIIDLLILRQGCTPSSIDSILTPTDDFSTICTVLDFEGWPPVGDKVMEYIESIFSK
jgi:hypothetical protein